jgi:hypothetical protein
LILGIFLVAGFTPNVSFAVTPEELYDRGYTAYTRGDFVKASQYLFAFLQLSPLSQARTEIEAALRFSEEQLRLRTDRRATEKPALPSHSALGIAGPTISGSGSRTFFATAAGASSENTTDVATLKQENDSLRTDLIACQQQVSAAGR